jgi:GMP synthase-like glutamine amidotransferase
MLDIFYVGSKPNLFAFEKEAESIFAAATYSKTKFYWFIYGSNDYSNFDFDWRPAPWEETHIHCFGTQWQRTGGAYLVNKDTVQNKEWHFRTEQKVTRCVEMSRWIVPSNINDDDFDYSWHPDELEPDYEYHFATNWQRDGGPIYRGTAGIKYVSSQKIRANATQIFYMDFLNAESQSQYSNLQKIFPDIKLTRYVDNHLNVFKRIVNLATTEFIWIISSICDYRDFDFTWHPDPSQREMVHVFASGTQRRGDTFYIHVESFKQQLYELELLDWFNVINYCTDQTVHRFREPTVLYDDDTIVDAVKNYEFNFPYATFINSNEFVYREEIICLWSAKDRVAVPLTTNSGTSLIPRDAKSFVQTQIYDYPYISKEVKKTPNRPLDIVFISNGEPYEELLYHHTEYMTNSDVKWIRGIDGRVAAYQAAAKASETPWFFAVWAKLEVSGGSFPWGEWQPDFWQQPKHYIFNAKNPVNGLEYGHQGMVAYNKKLVLENNNPGIDFTLSQPHESVPLLSGVARFNQNAWVTWRTAFREVVKLKHFMVTQPTLETEYRLDVWLKVANGDHAEWCLRGAADAEIYYNEVNGNYDKLMLSFEWAWLKDKFNYLYKNN